MGTDKILALDELGTGTCSMMDSIGELFSIQFRIRIRVRTFIVIILLTWLVLHDNDITWRDDKMF